MCVVSLRAVAETLRRRTRPHRGGDAFTSAAASHAPGAPVRVARARKVGAAVENSMAAHDLHAHLAAQGAHGPRSLYSLLVRLVARFALLPRSAHDVRLEADDARCARTSGRKKV